MDYTTHEYIRSEVERQVNNKLTPNFFDFMFQEMRFKNLTNDAVSKFLPSEVSKQLSQSSGIVASHVNSQVPSLVTQAMTNQFSQMHAQFDSKLIDQRQRFETLQTQHLDRLKSSSEDLIKSQVESISSNNNVIDMLRSQLFAQQEIRLQQLISSQQQEISTLRKDLANLRNSVDTAHEKVNFNMFLTIMGTIIVLPPALAFWKLLS
jgi:DNA anti-recombination protein RmuC